MFYWSNNCKWGRISRAFCHGPNVSMDVLDRTNVLQGILAAGLEALPSTMFALGCLTPNILFK